MLTISTSEFTTLVQYVKQKYGISLKNEKKMLVESRLFGVLQHYGFTDYEHYFSALVSDKTGKMEQELIEKISTNHTFFLREKDHFDYIRQTILPELERTLKENELRAWSAGCSSGEEPYTLAMACEDYLCSRLLTWKVQLLATDISPRVLKKAEAGIYSEDEMDHIPLSWKLKYFNKLDGDSYGVSERIKKNILFRNLNLTNGSFPFKKRFNMVFCRNVMIYFDDPTREALVKKFYECTEPGGYLFISHSESLGNLPNQFTYIKPSIYRKES